MHTQKECMWLILVAASHVCKCGACPSIAAGMHATKSKQVMCTLRAQSTHDEATADYSNKSVGMKLEATIQLQDDSGTVEYQLMLVIFREGGQNSGHFYVAAPTPAGTWRMFNNHQVLMPMQLRDLQKEYGKRVHGVVYRRRSAPAEDDWACLNPTALLGTNATRQVPPYPAPPPPPLPCSSLMIGAGSDQSDRLVPQIKQMWF